MAVTAATMVRTKILRKNNKKAKIKGGLGWMKNIWNDPRSLFNGNHFSSNSVTKIIRKIRATTFTEKLRKITRVGDERQG